MADFFKILLNLLTGFLTLILSNILPIKGGGVSLIFVITIPLTVGLSLIGILIYWYFLKSQRTTLRDITIYSIITLNLLITFVMFPYG